MGKRTKNRNNPPENLLTIIPKHETEWQETNEGKVSLLKPKIKNPRFLKFFSNWTKQTHYYIHLDEIGSSTWKLIDGHRTVETIGLELHKKYGADIEPVYERLAEFIRQLLRSKFVSGVQGGEA